MQAAAEVRARTRGLRSTDVSSRSSGFVDGEDLSGGEDLWMDVLFPRYGWCGHYLGLRARGEMVVRRAEAGRGASRRAYPLTFTAVAWLSDELPRYIRHGYLVGCCSGLSLTACRLEARG